MDRFKNLFAPIQKNSQRIALLGGIALLVVSYVLGFFYPALFFRAYLVGFVFWLSLALGSFAILLLHHLAKGAWGASMMRILEAGARTLPWLSLIGLPLMLSLPWLYVWARPEAVSADPALQHKALYLNIPFFIGRTVFYFAVWNGMVYLIERWSRLRDETNDARYTDKLRRAGAIGLAIFGVTVSFAAMDWIMSLEPDWFSTIFPAIVAIGGVLAGFAFAVLVTVLLTRRGPLSEISSPQLFNDLGNLLVAFVMMWAYLAFSQYLLIWMGNLPEEITWYLRRLSGGWETIALIIGIFYFILPFAFLILREVKQHRWTLAVVALLLVLTRWLEVFWFIVPAFEPAFTLNLLDVLAVLGIGGVWLAMFARELSRRALLAPTEPKVQEAKEWSREEHLPRRA